MIQLQGDQRKDVKEFLTDKKDGLELDAKTIKVRSIILLPTLFTYLPSPYKTSLASVIHSDFFVMQKVHGF